MKKRIIVFSPHPDDETLACGGTIAKAVHQGDEVYVVTMTDGRNSHRTVLGIDENPTPEEVRAIRRSESQEAAKALGIGRDNLIFLDFVDGSLDRNISESARRVREILAELEPDKILVPSEQDIQKDHHATSTAVSVAVRELDIHPSRYEYVVWPDSRKLQIVLRKLGGIIKPPNVIRIDISGFLHQKLNAISAYKSQVALLFPSQKKPILSESFIASFAVPTECFFVVSL